MLISLHYCVRIFCKKIWQDLLRPAKCVESHNSISLENLYHCWSLSCIKHKLHVRPHVSRSQRATEIFIQEILRLKVWHKFDHFVCSAYLRIVNKANRWIGSNRPFLKICLIQIGQSHPSLSRGPINEQHKMQNQCGIFFLLSYWKCITEHLVNYLLRSEEKTGIVYMYVHEIAVHDKLSYPYHGYIKYIDGGC